MGLTSSLQGASSLHPELIKLLRVRGVEDPQKFLSWSLKDIPDLTQLKDIKKASGLICEALDKNKKIGVYGDYDVDGTTSCALLHYFFKYFNTDVEIIQPSRFIEGYGIHPSSIDQAIGQKVELLITVDCGITNCEAAEYAKLRGLDLIITDHHKDGAPEMPSASAIVNPNRRDEEDSKLKALAGVGVAFALAVQVKRDWEEKYEKSLPSLYPLLPFVAIGTICDMALLDDVNKPLVRHGLKELRTCRFPGLQRFLSSDDKTGNFIASEKCSFNIGPMINSKGRIDHPEAALKLLTSSDLTEAQHYFSLLEIANQERKAIQHQVFEQAKQQMLKEVSNSSPPACIVYQEDWHEGVIGIVASKLVENFNMPAFVFTRASEVGLLKASVRSAGELNIFETLNQFRELFVKFGGHSAAAGLSLSEENFEPFKKRMLAHLADIPAILRTNELSHDIDLPFDQITPTLIRDLDKLEPFGQGNPAPLFRHQNLKLIEYDILKDVHVKWTLADRDQPQHRFKGISFFYLGKYDTRHPRDLYQVSQANEPLTAYFQVGVNRFKGNQFIQLQVKKLDLT